MPPGRSVGQLVFQKGAKTFHCLQTNAFWVLRGPTFYFEKELRGPNFCFGNKMLKRVTVFEIMPSGRSVGPNVCYRSPHKRELLSKQHLLCDP